MPLMVGAMAAAVLRPRRGPLYDTATQAFFDRITVAGYPEPDATWKAAYDKFIKSLKEGATSASDVLAQIISLNRVGAYDPDVALMNLKSSSFALSRAGGMTTDAGDWLVNKGYKGDGTAKYLEWAFADNDVSTGLWSQNSGFLLAGINGGTAYSQGVAGIASSGGGVANNVGITPRNGSGALSGRMHAGVNIANATVPTHLGISSVVRRNSTDHQSHKNGVAMGTGANASTGTSSSNLCLIRAGTNFSQFQVNWGCIAGPLTDAQIYDLHTAMAVFNADVGDV